MNALELKGVVKRYPGFTLDVSMAVPTGFVTGFVGANGAGKTTTIKCALGLVKPDAGEVSIIEKERIGIVFDAPCYNPDWTVAAVGRIMAGFYPSWDSDSFAALTEGVGVPSGKAIKTLSRGMGMKLQLAVAFSHGASLLLLDEPTSGLDPYARDEFLSTIADFMTDETHSVLFSSHITSDLERIADYVVVLDGGSVRASGAKDELLDSFALVSGGLAGLTPDVSGAVVGLRRHGTGWDGVVAAADVERMPSDVIVERPSLEDLVIRTVKEHAHV